MDNANRKPSNPDLTPSERDTEAALAGLRPAPVSFDAERVLALARFRHERRRAGFWRGVSGAMAAGLALALWTRSPSASPRVDRPLPPAAVIDPHVDAPPAANGPMAYLTLRQRVEREGLDALTPPDDPRPTTAPQAPVSRPSAGGVPRLFDPSRTGIPL